MTGLLAISIETLSKSTLHNFAFIDTLSATNLSGSLIPSAGYVNSHSWLSGLSPEDCGKAFRYVLAGDGTLRIKTPKQLSAPSVLPDRLVDIFSFFEETPLDSPNYWRSKEKDYKTIFEHASLERLSQRASIWPERIDLDKVSKWATQCFLMDVDFVFLEIGDADSVGHEHGPDSQPYAEVTQQIDSIIESIFNSCRGISPGSEIFLFGDNGMTPVDSYIDILSILKALGLTEKNSTVFIDSVIARIWTKDKHIVERLSAFNWNSIDTFVLDAKIKNDLKFNLDRSVVGDVTIMAFPGSMYYPNYFSKCKERGTHGYGKLSEKEPPYFVHFYPNSTNSMEINATSTNYMYESFCAALTRVAELKRNVM